MKKGDKIFCKKDSYTSSHGGKIVHKKGVVYIVDIVYNYCEYNFKKGKKDYYNRIFLKSERISSSVDSYGYHLDGYNAGRWKTFSNFFMTEKELRKTKLKKLNEEI